MAKIEELIPFVLYFEVGLSRAHLGLPLDAMFQQAKKTGFANDPDDSGGATMCGVTIGTFAAYRKSQGHKTTTVADLKNTTYQDWRAIMKKLFWDKWQADTIENQAIANILVDWVWASGNNGIKIPQRILGVTADGIVGAKTLAALKSAEPRKLFEQIHAARLKFVDDIVARKPSQKKFIRGWKRRINAITFNGLKYD